MNSSVGLPAIAHREHFDRIAWQAPEPNSPIADAEPVHSAEAALKLFDVTLATQGVLRECVQN